MTSLCLSLLATEEENVEYILANKRRKKPGLSMGWVKGGPQAEFKWAGPNSSLRSHRHWPVSSVCSMLHWPVHKKFGSIVISFRKTIACNSTAQLTLSLALVTTKHILSLARILMRKKCQRRQRYVLPVYFLFPCRSIYLAFVLDCYLELSLGCFRLYLDSVFCNVPL